MGKQWLPFRKSKLFESLLCVEVNLLPINHTLNSVEIGSEGGCPSSTEAHGLICLLAAEVSLMKLWQDVTWVRAWNFLDWDVNYVYHLYEDLVTPSEYSQIEHKFFNYFALAEVHGKQYEAISSLWSY